MKWSLSGTRGIFELKATRQNLRPACLTTELDSMSRRFDSFLNSAQDLETFFRYLYLHLVIFA